MSSRLFLIEDHRNSAFADRIIGTSGDDWFRPKAGADTILGSGDGDDTLEGGEGRDTLLGGEEADAFRFAGPYDAPDVIELSAAGCGAGLTARMDLASAGRFVANATGRATGTVGQFVYETDVGKLWWDADGAGAGARVLVARIADAPALTTSDLVVIG